MWGNDRPGLEIHFILFTQLMTLQCAKIILLRRNELLQPFSTSWEVLFNKQKPEDFSSILSQGWMLIYFSHTLDVLEMKCKLSSSNVRQTCDEVVAGVFQTWVHIKSWGSAAAAENCKLWDWGIIMSANNISIIIIICCSNGFENFSGQNIDVFLGVRLL